MGTKQPLYLNGKIFNSMNKAAKFLRISVSTLADKLRNKEATVYKDILIEKTKIEPKPQPKLLKRKGIPVLVDGVMYNSCKDAEKVIGCGIGSLADAIRNRGKTMFFGHLVEPVYPSMVGKRKRNAKDAVKVLCKTTGITYNTITEAAKVAEADDRTMSKKMETNGSFIDKNGNEYIRLKPMGTKNTYRKTHKTATFDLDKRFVGCEELTKVNFDNIKPVEPVVEKKLKFENYPQVIQGLIRKEIRTMIREDKPWSEIKKFLRDIGCETLTIKVDVDE